ncbi:DUF1878 domain-containing protein [Clostridium perfringens]|uniref:DUF1878 domain-containing protein n=1 Tax=Clostridium perfringens TaxID=1502 RepID=UPI0039E9E663
MCNDLNTVNERLDFLEFRQDLLFENSHVSRFLFETRTTRKQYNAIMDVMDHYREMIENGQEVNNYSFERSIYEAIGSSGDYHFCEDIAKSFMEDGRWPEVFPALYGHFDKYRNYMNNYKHE